MLAKTMADELGPRNIRVLGLLPGRLETDRVRELDDASGRPKKLREEFERQIPLGPLRRGGRVRPGGRLRAVTGRVVPQRRR